MNDSIVAEKIAQWQKLKALVLDSVSSPITKRIYSMALDEFLSWFHQEPRPDGFCKATVSAWRISVEARGLGSSSIIIRMSAIRKLAAEAADNGLIAPELAAGVARVKSAKWWALVHRRSKGKGLARSHDADADLGEGGDRCVDVPSQSVRWLCVPSVSRAGRMTGRRLGEKVVWQMLQTYTGRQLVFQGSRLMTFAARAQSSAAPPVGNLSRSNCSSGTFGANHGTISRDEAGSRSRAELRDQVESTGVEIERRITVTGAKYVGRAGMVSPGARQPLEIRCRSEPLFF
jgi:hypothetical protein